MTCRILLACLILASIVCLTFAVVTKMTNVRCDSFNKSWVIVKECRLRAIRRDRTVFNMNVNFLHPAKYITISGELYKRANGYKPYLYNATIDFCKYMQKPFNPLLKIVYSLFGDFSNINHTCPYVGEQIISGFYLRPEVLRLPFFGGDYLLKLTWILHNKLVFFTNVYFSYTEDLLAKE